jgi:hypothetical protein
MSLYLANKPTDASAEHRSDRGRTVQDARGRAVGFIAPRTNDAAFGLTTDVLPSEALAMNCDPYNRLGRACAEIIYKRLR